MLDLIRNGVALRTTNRTTTQSNTKSMSPHSNGNLGNGNSGKGSGNNGTNKVGRMLYNPPQQRTMHGLLSDALVSRREQARMENNASNETAASMISELY